MEYLLFFLTALFMLFILRKVAKKVHLVDRPNERKQHQGLIPLVGGISIYITLMLVLWVKSDLLVASDIYVLCASVLVLMGVIDDKYDVDYRIRLVIQILISCAMIFGAGLSLKSLGGLVFGHELVLGPLGYIVTVFAVLGAINAFNMVDGIDGLLGGLTLATFGGLAYISYIDEQMFLARFCLLMMIVVLPYIILNLGFPFGVRRKVFMGDAGSMLIGFTVIWVLLQGTQGPKAQMYPVTALWLIAIPLMDMVTIMVRRVRKGHSPFKPDREHLHHICMKAGLSSRQTLLFICLLAVFLAAGGITLEALNVPEIISLLLFIVVFLLYFSGLNAIWRILAWLRKRGIFSSHEAT
ncbi:UDP-N-acetylglucosamine--undecaprenyl-phosphate N-acetylglucosaminephosphotransferase [Aeromonas veronii]|uniref:UDP-N-acetylglucosamine--undecaprenyl-phosphate N-acetylglucosaminephosphotransferase n=1 Tax=Aeromonas veronii TaxID=654 RepID=UPI001882079F|nr:UDP-N-acetylglucosamine--undecaprenyl-phosphate N-acetylglucosaminephosphotransferase [Aeromonas veronii]MBE8735432.1 UDP-N-acetylglucosamine--undecaprenyl-phosphate N-acetylglucosaminephosphotransferase [Aeromonas veronii]MBE8740094.1 UDP-N-acetylglucosamine--undecaprenyl-phosphate N-acetylglucosaminephosphotransferase [Aeromonas veronii]MBE8742856.1 UDP-N-acetylglucosamine--undecaprenyl-phosphate N-acetylglucosaminephosphotransferase [Aeromonas veronii]MBE8762783.1 UDP-N-acetylglucosamine-